MRSGEIKRIRVVNNISNFTDRAINCIKNGEYMINDYNAKLIRDKFYEYYHYQTHDIRFFIGTLAELKIKLNIKVNKL
tara:strand:- start:513 stop:746 length:234 start_codon:yes stop_codon:yes gene_type:complete